MVNNVVCTCGDLLLARFVSPVHISGVLFRNRMPYRELPGCRHGNGNVATLNVKV